MRGLLVLLLLSVIGAVLAGCEPPEARPEGSAPGALAAKAAHARRHVALRSLVHARGHIERIADALYDEDDGEDDETGLAAPPHPSDDDAAPGLLAVELPEDPPPSGNATRHPPGRGLEPSSGHTRNDEPPPRS